MNLTSYSRYDNVRIFIGLTKKLFKIHVLILTFLFENTMMLIISAIKNVDITTKII